MTTRNQELSDPAATVAGTINVDERNNVMTTTLTCPSWCTASWCTADASSRIDEDSGSPGQHSTSVAKDSWTVFLDQEGDRAPEIMADDGHEPLTAAQARELAAAILTAADYADGREPGGSSWLDLINWLMATRAAAEEGAAS